jgi:hypothetical protein
MRRGQVFVGENVTMVLWPSRAELTCNEDQGKIEVCELPELKTPELAYAAISHGLRRMADLLDQDIKEDGDATE